MNRTTRGIDSLLLLEMSTPLFFSDINPTGRKSVKVKVIQSYLTLCDPMDYTVHGIL